MTTKTLVDLDSVQTLINKSISIAATGSIKLRTLEYRFSQEYWITDFQDFGTANDSSALQSAIASAIAAGARIIHVPAGVFLLGTSVTIPSYLTLMGQGIGVTIFRATSSLPLKDPMIVGVTGDTGFGVRIDTNICFIGITFDGVGRNYPAWDVGTNPAIYGGLTVANMRGNLIRFYSAINVKFLYCEIMNHESIVLSLAGCLRPMVYGCVFHGNGKVDDVSPGLYIPKGSFPNTTPTTDVMVEGNVFHDNLRSAILFNPLGGGSVIGNRFADNGESTIFSDEGNAMIIDNNYLLRSTITDIVSSGVEINESTNSRVTNNTFNTMDGSGVSCNGMTDGVISGNTIINCGQGAVYPGGPFNFAAGRSPGDPVSDDRRSGISLETGNTFRVLRVQVCNNIIVDNQGSPTMQFGISVTRTGTPTFPCEELFMADNTCKGGAQGNYNIVRQACTSTVKLRDRGWPYMTQVQVPASTGPVTYSIGYRPTYIKANAIQVSTTVSRTAMGMAMYDPSQSAEAERGQEIAVQETGPDVNADIVSNVLIELIDAAHTVQCSGNLTTWTDDGFIVDWTVVTIRPYITFECWP